ncbi:MAG: saccharopine dehydrogenase [Pseudomonadota bacterium]
MTAPRILIVGGYGVVGAQVAALLAGRNPQLEIWIGGRSLEKASNVAKAFPNARGVQIDADAADPLAEFAEMPDVILAVANDDDDHLLLSAARRGIAFIDIARWTERMHGAIARLESVKLTAPVILASGWMAGVAATVAAQLATGMAKIDTITIDILYALKDKAGPNSVAYMDRLNIPFTIYSGGKPRSVMPMTDARTVNFSEGRTLDCYRLDIPEQFTLVRNLGAAGVSSRITYDDVTAIKLMLFLIRSRIWAILSWNIFAKVRHALLYNPGEGAPQETVLEVSGEAHDGKSASHRVTIFDALGQTHMTAAGAVSQVERVLGLSGRVPPPHGVSFPEQLTDHAEAMTAHMEMGVSISSH